MIGRNMKKIRLARTLSQIELAQRVGIRQPYISQMENGICNNPSLEILTNLAVALDVTITDLMEGAAGNEKSGTDFVRCGNETG